MKLRRPKFLSPSSMALHEKNPEAWFFRYACPIKTPRPPQEAPMSVGSAFDAIVKNQILVDLTSYQEAKDQGYGMTQLFSEQVEEHSLPESIEVAAYLWEHYKECGAYPALLEDIRRRTDLPRMEFDVTGTVGGVPLLGKPDLHFYTPGGIQIITDWKVMGSTSNYGASPQPGYAVARDTIGSRTHNQAHKRFRPEVLGDVQVNGVPMNETTYYWADQLATYAWCLGEDVGSENFVARIEQLACRPNKAGLRVKCATHQSYVSSDYQRELLERYKRVWSAIENDHIFLDVPKSESLTRCEMLLRSISTPKDNTGFTKEDMVDFDGFSF